MRCCKLDLLEYVCQLWSDKEDARAAYSLLRPGFQIDDQTKDMKTLLSYDRRVTEERGKMHENDSADFCRGAEVVMASIVTVEGLHEKESPERSVCRGCLARQAGIGRSVVLRGPTQGWWRVLNRLLVGKS